MAVSSKHYEIHFNRKYLDQHWRFYLYYRQFCTLCFSSLNRRIRYQAVYVL